MRLNPNMRTRQMPDKALLSSILALIIFGWLMSFSASLAYFSSYSFFFKQTIFIGAGLFAGLIMLNTPISTLQKYSIPLFILSLILLTVVFFPPPIGHTVNGSTRWINFVFFKFQPSELMKLSMVLFMAGFLIRQEKDIRKPWKGFLKTLVIIGIADVLLLLETDFGATLIISLTALAMLYAAGVFLKQLSIVTAGLFAFVGIFIYLNPNRIARLTSFWVDDFWGSTDAKVHQTQQALIGIARGDWFGTGIGAGIQKYSLLPERHTDMIFAVIGEELGSHRDDVCIAFLFIYIVKRIQDCKGSASKRKILQLLCCLWNLHLVCDANHGQYWHEFRSFASQRIYIATAKLWRNINDICHNFISHYFACRYGK